MPRKPKPLIIRMLNVFYSLSLLASLGYALFAGFDLIALGVITAAMAGAATPVLLSGGGIFEVMLGVVEAIVEGVVAVFEGVCNAISGLFSW